MCFAIVFTSKLNAQVSMYTFAQMAGTSTPITGGTAVATATGFTGATALDDNAYTGQAIPFTFTFNGIGYTSLAITSNGFITFGATAPAGTNYTPISNTATYSGAVSGIGRDIRGVYATTATRTTASNILTAVTNVGFVAPGDLVSMTGVPAGTIVTAVAAGTITMSAAATSTGTGTVTFATGQIRTETLGVTPNQIHVIQFTRFQAYNTLNTSYNFQIRLYETSNVVEVVYGPFISGATVTATQVGLRGAANTDFNNRTTTTDWSASTAGAVNTASHTLSATVFPASGQTYVWTPPVPPACPQPTLLTATGITTTTANLGWTCTACTGTFVLEYGPTGFTPGTGTIVNPATSPVPVTGLTPATTYQFYVMQDCSGSGNGLSLVTGPFSFTTHFLGDDVCNALPLIFGTNGPYNSAGSTNEVGEPAAPAGGCNTQTTWCNSTLNGSYWFTFVAPASGRVSIAAPGFDDQIALYSAANCAAILSGGSTLIAANDDGGASFSAVVNPVNCLTPGVTYYVQVDQYNATTGTFTVVLTDLGAADPSFTGLAATYCDNSAAATLTPAVTGGVFAGTGVTGSTFNPATAGAGTYSVTYTLNGCYTSTQSVTVNASPVASSSVTSPVLCNGGNATVTVSATGGTPSYTGIGAFTAPAGAYSYTVTDANSCASTTTGTITQPTAVTVTPSSTAILCNGGTSTVTIVASGGTPTYTGEGTFTQSAGTTVYTVTDANSCVGTASVVVTEPTAVVVTPSSSAVLCNGGTSTVTIVASGGTPAYTGEGTFTQSAGTTVYTVTDANSCVGTASVVVTEPTAIVVSYSETGVLCNGGTSSVTISATGGTPAYTGEGTFTQSAGTTVYTVTDANSCSSTVSVVVTEPTALMAMSSFTPIACNGGSSTVTISGMDGTGPYTGEGTFSQTAGTTVYTVTDANGCTANTSVVITEPTAISASVVTVNASCFGLSDGSIDLTVTGGTAPYTFDWNSGAFTTEDLTGIPAGVYAGVVTDNNGCTDGGSVTITEPALLVATASGTNVNCNGVCDGTSSIVISGGTSGYTIDWTPGIPSGDGTSAITNLCPGTYTGTITDANGCTASSSYTVTEPAAIAASQTVNLCSGQSVTVGTSTYTSAGTYTDVLTAFNSCDSTVTTIVTTSTVDVSTSVAGAVITANSATGTYQWLDCNAGNAPIAGETNQTYTAIANGDYAVEVTDGGCVDTSACVNINITGISNNTENVLSIYPNPTMGMFNIVISNANISELIITIVDIQGKEVFSSVDKNVNGTFNKQINLEGISNGLYYIKMNTGAEVKIQKLIVQ